MEKALPLKIRKSKSRIFSCSTRKKHLVKKIYTLE
jgi:hypothetical protein